MNGINDIKITNKVRSENFANKENRRTNYNLDNIHSVAGSAGLDTDSLSDAGVDNIDCIGKKIAILGSGRFAVALYSAIVSSPNVDYKNVSIWASSSSVETQKSIVSYVAEHKHMPNVFESVRIESPVYCTIDEAICSIDADLIFCVTPSFTMANVAKQVVASIEKCRLLNANDADNANNANYANDFNKRIDGIDSIDSIEGINLSNSDSDDYADRCVNGQVVKNEPRKTIVLCAKGINNSALSANSLLYSQVFKQKLTDAGINNVGVCVLCGPSFAGEIVSGVPTDLTLAYESDSLTDADFVSHAVRDDALRSSCFNKDMNYKTDCKIGVTDDKINDNINTSINARVNAGVNELVNGDFDNVANVFYGSCVTLEPALHALESVEVFGAYKNIIAIIVAMNEKIASFIGGLGNNNATDCNTHATDFNTLKDNAAVNVPEVFKNKTTQVLMRCVNECIDLAACVSHCVSAGNAVNNQGCAERSVAGASVAVTKDSVVKCSGVSVDLGLENDIRVGRGEYEDENKYTDVLGRDDFDPSCNNGDDFASRKVFINELVDDLTDDLLDIDLDAVFDFGFDGFIDEDCIDGIDDCTINKGYQRSLACKDGHAGNSENDGAVGSLSSDSYSSAKVGSVFNSVVYNKFNECNNSNSSNGSRYSGVYRNRADVAAFMMYSAGIGDIVLTSSGDSSRNRMFGLQLGEIICRAIEDNINNNAITIKDAKRLFFDNRLSRLLTKQQALYIKRKFNYSYSDGLGDLGGSGDLGDSFRYESGDGKGNDLSHNDVKNNDAKHNNSKHNDGKHSNKLSNRFDKDEPSVDSESSAVKKNVLCEGHGSIVPFVKIAVKYGIDAPYLKGLYSLLF